VAEPLNEPEVTVVIPIYNEAAILAQSVEGLVAGLRDLLGAGAFEVLLAENGSRDGTPALAAELGERFEEVETFSYPEPNYGGALREGIYRARGRFVICEEIDLCDLDFHARALEVLRSGEAEMVIGSKAMRGANDQRPLKRRVATLAYNGLLRVTLGFRGTDTHGLKAFTRAPLLPIAAGCVVEHDVFASEFVIRAQRAGRRCTEIPVELNEKRAPSIRLGARVPRVLKNLMRLMVSIHLTPESDASSPEPAARD
jgi:glycosyltransferase involved in cell wall biosynthesis